MKTRSAYFWLWLLLAILVMSFASFWFLDHYREYCVQSLFTYDGNESTISKRNNFFVDLGFILSSLWLTALFFFLIGKLFGGGKKSSKNEEVIALQNQLKECQNQYDQLMVSSSGGKIEKQTRKPLSENIQESFIASEKVDVEPQEVEREVTKEVIPPTKSVEEEEVSELDKLLEQKKKELKEAHEKGEVVFESDVKEVSFNEENAKEAFGKKVVWNDLKIIEGVGPKIESILHQHDIKTWRKLALTQPSVLSEYLLAEGGAAYKIHDPSTWPKQAQLAAEGKFSELKDFQDHLKGGKEV